MEKEVPIILQNSKNDEVLRFLEHKSCHGDIVGPIEAVLNEYSEVKAFCPDGANFKYRVWYANDVIFAFAHGMSHVCLRLPKPNTRDNEIKGSFERELDNETWWSFKYDYRNLNVWVNNAYTYAKIT